MAQLNLVYMLSLFATAISTIVHVNAEAGAYDSYMHRSGEKRGQLNPAEITAIVVASLALTGAFCVTLFFCYCVYSKQARSGHQKYAYQRP